VNDEALLARQADLQRDAETFVRELGLIELLGRAGRVLQLGSAVTGLMVWRDVDFGVDAPGLTTDAAWETVRPLLGRCSALHYANEHEERRLAPLAALSRHRERLGDLRRRSEP
jgi:hypothetical protein